MQIFVFGDSVVYGRWDKNGGWIQRLRKLLDKKTLSTKGGETVTIYNLGIPSSSAKDILERFDSEMENRCDQENIIIFATGLTDAVFYFKSNSPCMTLDAYKETLPKLLQAAQKYKPKTVLFVGPTPVDEARAAPFPWDNSRSLKNEDIAKYNDALRDFCKGNGLPFINLYKKMMKAQNFIKLYDSDYAGGLNQDGIHPNSKGHTIISNMAKKELKKSIPL